MITYQVFVGGEVCDECGFPYEGIFPNQMIAIAKQKIKEFVNSNGWAKESSFVIRVVSSEGKEHKIELIGYEALNSKMFSNGDGDITYK